MGTVHEEADLLAVDVPPGRSVVHVRYLPRHILLGLIMTLLTAIAIALYFARKRLRLTARGGSAAAP